MSKKNKKEPEKKPQDAAVNSEAEQAEEQAAEQPAAEDTEKKPDPLQAQIEELDDRLKRTMAEFDNYRKRTEKEKASRFEMGQRSVVEKLLPIADIFEKGLGSLDEEALSQPFAQGMEQTHRQLADMLSSLGVAPIEAVGTPFNPDFHNAVMHVEDGEQPDNTVIEEFQKGYTMNGTVIRYSMVKVAN